MAVAKFISEDFQSANDISVKWFNVKGLEYSDDGVYGLYSDGVVVDDENYPVEFSDYAVSELQEILGK